MHLIFFLNYATTSAGLFSLSEFILCYKMWKIFQKCRQKLEKIGKIMTFKLTILPPKDLLKPVEDFKDFLLLLRLDNVRTSKLGIASKASPSS